MVEELVSKFGRNLSCEKAHEVVNDFLADTCKDILCNTAVFKNDEKGLAALDKFMKEVF
jgi:galactose-1-phosphate uridylyltransferase